MAVACVLSFFLAPFRMTWTSRRSSGPGVMALASSFAATAMLRSLGRASRAQAEGDSMGIPPLPMGPMGGSPGSGVQAMTPLGKVDCHFWWIH